MRAILIRDPNRMIAAAVLSSPKLSEPEVEAIAGMGSVSDEVLRIIGNNRQWIKNYMVVLRLCKNSKTPLAMSMNLMNRLQDGDLRGCRLTGTYRSRSASRRARKSCPIAAETRRWSLVAGYLRRLWFFSQPSANRNASAPDLPCRRSPVRALPRWPSTSAGPAPWQILLDRFPRGLK